MKKFTKTDTAQVHNIIVSTRYMSWWETEFTIYIMYIISYQISTFGDVWLQFVATF
jgi:hypothetical protein